MADIEVRGDRTESMDRLVMARMIPGVRIARRAIPKIHAARLPTDGSVPRTGGPGKKTKSRKT